MREEDVVIEIHFGEPVTIDWQAYIKYCNFEPFSMRKWMLEKIGLENPHAQIEGFEHTGDSDFPLVKFVLFSSFAPHIANYITMPIQFTSAFKKPPHPSE